MSSSNGSIERDCDVALFYSAGWNSPFSWVHIMFPYPYDAYPTNSDSYQKWVKFLVIFQLFI